MTSIRITERWWWWWDRGSNWGDTVRGGYTGSGGEGLGLPDWRMGVGEDGSSVWGFRLTCQ